MPRTFKVTIDRDGCISCAACWAACQEMFEENPDDGLNQIVEQYRVDGSLAEGLATEEMEDCVREGADVCPVEVIHVEE
ncbi:MAG: ferredoxin [Bacteroidetes bacterium]|nr:ferredoxin [Bacteroidota bacterium]